MTDYIPFTFKTITMKTNWYIVQIIILTAVTRVNLPFCDKSMTVVRNGGLIAFVIAFIDMASTENKFGPKKIDE